MLCCDHKIFIMDKISAKKYVLSLKIVHLKKIQSNKKKEWTNHSIYSSFQNIKSVAVLNLNGSNRAPKKHSNEGSDHQSKILKMAIKNENSDMDSESAENDMKTLQSTVDDRKSREKESELYSFHTFSCVLLPLKKVAQ